MIEPGQFYFSSFGNFWKIVRVQNDIVFYKNHFRTIESKIIRKIQMKIAKQYIENNIWTLRTPYYETPLYKKLEGINE